MSEMIFMTPERLDRANRTLPAVAETLKKAIGESNAIRPLLCDGCLAIFEGLVPGDGAEFCRKCEAKLAAVLDAARGEQN
ncbi:MAG: hypothetical protein WBE47_19030 [Candidatus Acidiferrales bacterium]